MRFRHQRRPAPQRLAACARAGATRRHPRGAVAGSAAPRTDVGDRARGAARCADDRAAPRRGLHGDAHLVPGRARAGQALPRRGLRPALARPRHRLRALLALRLRRRRRGGDHRAGPGQADHRWLLHGLRGRPARLAPASRRRRGPGARRHHRPLPHQRSRDDLPRRHGGQHGCAAHPVEVARRTTSRPGGGRGPGDGADRHRPVGPRGVAQHQPVGRRPGGGRARPAPLDAVARADRRPDRRDGPPDRLGDPARPPALTSRPASPAPPSTRPTAATPAWSSSRRSSSRPSSRPPSTSPPGWSPCDPRPSRRNARRRPPRPASRSWRRTSSLASSASPPW